LRIVIAFLLLRIVEPPIRQPSVCHLFS